MNDSNTPEPEGMDSLYASETEEKSSSQHKTQESIDQEEKEGMETSAIVPIKLLSPEGEPLKEGDEIVVKVKALHGQDEAEIVYAPKKGGSYEEQSPEDELDSLSTE